MIGEDSMENFQYLRVIKRSQIPLEVGEQICSLLSKETLDRLFLKFEDTRLIKPILDMAKKMPNGINDDNINAILDDSNAVTRLMAIYCK